MTQRSLVVEKLGSIRAVAPRFRAVTTLARGAFLTSLTIGLFAAASPAQAQVDVVCYDGASITLDYDDGGDCELSTAPAGGLDVNNFGDLSATTLSTPNVKLDTGVNGLSTFSANVNMDALVQIKEAVITKTSIGGSLNVIDGATADFNGTRIQNVGDPTADGDAANKAYVDSVAGGSSDRLDAVEAKNTEQDGRLDTAEAKNDEQDGRLDTAEATNDEQDGRLDTAEATNDEQDGRLDTAEATNDEQDGRLDSVEAVNTTQNTRLDGVEAKNVEQDERLDGGDIKDAEQDSRLVEHDTQLASLDARVTTNTGDIAALDGRVGELEGGLAFVSREVSENKKEARQGIAAAIAMTTASMPSAPGRTSWAGNFGFFKGATAFGGSFAHRLDFNNPVALTGGYAYGGGNSHGFRVGMAGEF